MSPANKGSLHLRTEDAPSCVRGFKWIGTLTPTAFLHIRRELQLPTPTPLKTYYGVNLTTAEAGAAEYDGTICISHLPVQFRKPC